MEQPIFKNLHIHDIKGELWLPIVGYEGLYEVSNMGRVKSLSRVVQNSVYGNKVLKGCILSQTQLKSKYLAVGLSNMGTSKTYRVHRIVALHFVENPENKPEVNHKWGNKLDNRACMLEWATRIENIHHALNTGLTNQKGVNSNLYGKKGRDSFVSKKINQYSIDGVFIKTWDSISDVVRELKVVRSCIKRKGYSKGFRWVINPCSNENLVSK